MNEIQAIQRMLSEVGIEAEEVFTGESRACPVCRCERPLAA
ncbi:MAG TPA: hypothetical protein VLT15_05020 [Acidimicrobiia bacterium]|nr:hypothetical protein [Acidimicrobiia bacterium]